MRLYIRNNNLEIIHLLESYLSIYLENQTTNIVINGEKFNNISIKTINIEKESQEGNKSDKDEKFYVLKVFSIQKEIFNVPISIEQTKVDLGKEQFLFQTQDYQSLIEVVEKEQI